MVVEGGLMICRSKVRGVKPTREGRRESEIGCTCIIDCLGLDLLVVLGTIKRSGR